MRVTSFVGLSLLIVSMSGPALAGNDAAKKDPNRVVCEKQEELGSRLSTKRICRTAAEWDALRHEARQNLEKAQTNRGAADGR